MEELKTIAQQIVEAVGEEQNVVSMGHCMTRLRFEVKDSDAVKETALRQIKGVKGVSKRGNQVQLIIGTGVVEEYYDAVNSISKFESADYSGLKNVNVFDVVMGTLSGSIAPWLGVLCGALIIQALLSLFKSIGVLDAASPTYNFFNLISSAFTYTFPIFIGFTAAEKLNTNKYMGAFIGAVLIFPKMMTAVSEGTVNFFGLPIQNATYTGTIFPVILACVVLKYAEKLAKKICPKVIYIFGVTLIEILIVMPVTYLVVGPLGNLIAKVLSAMIMWLYNTAGFMAPALLSMVLPFTVMGGIHTGLRPIATVMIADMGFDPIFFPSFMAWNVGAGGLSLAYALRSKDADKKSIGFSSALSGVLGISEPALFGVVSTSKKTIIATAIGLFLSGMVIGLTGYKVSVPFAQSIFSIPAAADIPGNMTACIISFVASFVICFVVGYIILGKEDK